MIVPVLDAAPFETHKEMKAVANALMIVGTFSGALAIGLLLIGWWDWAPFALMAGGGLLILAGAVGALART